SFTLTPMMCARMLRVSDAGGSHDSARSRRGVYRWVDAGYIAMLRVFIRHRFAVAVLGVGGVALPVPTFRLFPQDYLSTNVDHGKFEVRVTAPEGLSLTAMDEIMTMIEAKVRAVRGVKLVLGTSAGDYNGSLSNGRIYAQLVPHEERVFTWS